MKLEPLCDAPAGRGGTWNTDGQIVFTPNISDPLYVVSDSGGTPKAVTPATTGGRSDRVPFFLPDQKHFLYIEQFTATSNELHASYDILVGSVDGAMPRKVLSGEYDSPQFAEGKLLYGRDRSLYAQDFSLSFFSGLGQAGQDRRRRQYLPCPRFGELQRIELRPAGLPHFACSIH
jgi:eukaryotic-like serine/threonine-protein kinase